MTVSKLHTLYLRFLTDNEKSKKKSYAVGQSINFTPWIEKNVDINCCR